MGRCRSLNMPLCIRAPCRTLPPPGMSLPFPVLWNSARLYATLRRRRTACGRFVLHGIRGRRGVSHHVRFSSQQSMHTPFLSSSLIDLSLTNITD